MRRSNVHKKNSNRNSSSIFNHTNRITPNNLMPPSIYVDHMWIRDDDVTPTPGVQIIELNSSDSAKTANDDKDYNINSDLNIYGGHSNDQSYEGKVVQDKRSMELDQESTNDQSYDDNEYGEEFLYADLFGNSSNDIQKENVSYNRQVNCFTILDKHLADSDTSEEYANIELLGYEEPEWTRNARHYDSEIVSYTPETETEKRTVWIYSFKNKRLLSDNDFELVNIPSQDSNTIGSIEDFDQDKELLGESENSRAPTPLPKTNRMATPIPPALVPRFNLTLNPTLPTVTEITESEKQSSSNQTEPSFETSKRNVNLKENNWFLSEQVTPKERFDKAHDANSIMNWMALSPREKRRRFRNASPIILSPKQDKYLLTLPELSVCGDTADEDSECERKEDEKKHVKSTVDKSQQTINQSPKAIIERMSSVAGSTRRSATPRKSNLSSARETGNLKIEASESHNDASPNDRGDHLKTKVPRIRLSPKGDTKNISDPLEKLDGNNWIKEEKLIKDTVDLPTNARGDTASDRLWMRNVALLKPAQWSDYLPITESIPSLHLTINTESDDVHVSWFRRLGRFFRCCK